MIKERIEQFIGKLSIGPILRTMLRHKYGVLMLIVQIAITMAVTSNAIFIATDRYQQLQKNSGIDEQNTFVLTSSGFAENFNPRDAIENDLIFLRQLPNVIDVVKTNSFPFSDSGSWYDLQTEAGENKNSIPAAGYKLDEHGIQAFGLELIAGSNFGTNDVQWLLESDTTWPSPIILSKATAWSLFGSTDWNDIVGRTFFLDQRQPVIVKGIIDTLQAPWVDWSPIENTFISPIIVSQNSSRYVIRVKEGELSSSIAEIENLLAQRNKERVIRNIITISSARKGAYGPDIAAVTILIVIVVILIVIAAMGITGLTSFNILKRKNQIGIRRALGATKANIVYYFLVENMIQVSIGVILGTLLSLSLSVFLVSNYGLAKISLDYIVLSIVIMYFLGLAATLKPSLKTLTISITASTRDS